MLKTIIEAIKHDLDNALNLINILNDLIELNNEFLNPILDKILELINEIIKNQ